MKKRNYVSLYTAITLFIAFVLWTALVSFIDVQKIGPQGSAVGFAALNQYIHSLTGVNMTLYTVTDWLGLVPIGVALTFATLGLVQWIKRKSLAKVDKSIMILGGFYIAVMSVYLLFEIVTVNYRPVLIEGALETSYPSSTTMLAMCVMPTAAMQLKSRIKNRPLKITLVSVIVLFTAFMVVGRLLSGVHWFSDIVGGALVSAGLVLMYYFFCKLTERHH